MVPAARRLVAAAVLAAPLALTSAASAQPAARAPECVTVTVHAYQNDGTFHATRLEFCGGSPGADSALHDWAQGRPFTLDGAYAIGDGCGGRLDPCVIFPGG